MPCTLSQGDGPGGLEPVCPNDSLPQSPRTPPPGKRKPFLFWLAGRGARSGLGCGLKVNHPEAIAFITDFVV